MKVEDAKQAAVDFVIEHPEDARLVAMGTKVAPANTNDIMVKNAYATKVIVDGNYKDAEWAVSSLKNANTGYGQNIVANKAWTDEHSPLTWINKAQEAVESAAAKNVKGKGTAKFGEIKKQIMNEARQTIEKNKVNLKDVEDFIDTLICKD